MTEQKATAIMTKRTLKKAKEPVRIRTRRISNGNDSIYLDIYVDGVRKYEFLKMYLIPERTAVDKIRNANTLQAANAIKAARILDITNKKAGIVNHSAGGKISFDAFIVAYAAKKEKQGYKRTSYYALHVKDYLSKLGRFPMMSAVDKEYCLQFIQYLKRLELSQNTKSALLRILNGILNDAVRNDVISVNPLTKLDKTEKIPSVPSKREFLTADEVQMLINSTPPMQKVKQAFLFSCFCGLRFGDVKALRWCDIIRNGDKSYVRVTMQKTKRDIILPLSNEALRWLPERAENTKDDDLVFEKLHISQIDTALKKWMADVGIKKHVSYHVARHTFATMLITFGADLYTVSKLLGHTDIKVTQIYAKLVDAKKVEAVELFNGKFR